MTPRIPPRILAPLSRADEVPALVEAGADALYAGFQSEDFRRRFSAFFPANARPDGRSNFGELRELGRAFHLCQKHGRPLELVFNQPFGPRAAEAVFEEIRRCLDLGIRHFTVSRPGLLLRILEAEPAAEVGVSVLAGALNEKALDFFASLGAKRLALVPQVHGTWTDVLAGHAASIGLELSAFVLGALCPFVCSTCGFAHGRRSHGHGGALAVNVRLEELLAGAGPSPWAGRLHGLYEDLRGAFVSRSGPPCYWPVTDDDGKRFRFRPHPRASARACALCTGGRLLRHPAVRRWKIAGRDHVLGAKWRNVRFVRTARDLLLDGGDSPETRRRIREAHRRILGRPCSEAICFADEETP